MEINNEIERALSKGYEIKGAAKSASLIRGRLTSHQGRISTSRSFVRYSRMGFPRSEEHRLEARIDCHVRNSQVAPRRHIRWFLRSQPVALRTC
jgi:hypothetical protein